MKGKGKLTIFDARLSLPTSAKTQFEDIELYPILLKIAEVQAYPHSEVD